MFFFIFYGGVFVFLLHSVPREEENKRISSALLEGQVDLETRPRSILEEKKDTGLD